MGMSLCKTISSHKKIEIRDGVNVSQRVLILPVALALCELLEREDCGSEEEEGEEGEGEGGTGVLVVSGLPLSDPPPTTGSVALTSERNTGLVPEFCRTRKTLGSYSSVVSCLRYISSLRDI